MSMSTVMVEKKFPSVNAGLFFQTLPRGAIVTHLKLECTPAVIDLRLILRVTAGELRFWGNAHTRRDPVTTSITSDTNTRLTITGEDTAGKNMDAYKKSLNCSAGGDTIVLCRSSMTIQELSAIIKHCMQFLYRFTASITPVTLCPPTRTPASPINRCVDVSTNNQPSHSSVPVNASPVAPLAASPLSARARRRRSARERKARGEIKDTNLHNLPFTGSILDGKTLELIRLYQVRQLQCELTQRMCDWDGRNVDAYIDWDMQVRARARRRPDSAT